MAATKLAMAGDMGATALVQSVGGHTVVWMRGDHDRSTAWALGDAITQLGTSSGADVVFDLSGVDFIDAGVVGALVSARNVLLAQHRSVSLRHPSERAQRIFELCGVEAFDERAASQRKTGPSLSSAAQGQG